MIRRIKPWLGPLVVAVLLAVGALAAQSAAGQSLLQDAGLSPDPENFTELAFERPSKLPDVLAPDRPTTVDFRVHNSEGEPRAYKWSVEQRRPDGSGRRVLRQGSLPLRAGDSAVVRAPITPVCRPGKVRIEVRLQAPKQNIGWWIGCRP